MRIGIKIPIALAFCLGCLAGCRPELGDACSSNRDCSSQSNRYCDTDQPGGYCTLAGCDPDSCPSGGLCVEWRFAPGRAAETWCMKSCNTNAPCRTGSGYECVAPDDPRIADDNGDPITRIIDDNGGDTTGFCAYVGE